jgi:hypothetical protein
VSRDRPIPRPIGLAGILRNLPTDLPISLEVPKARLARTVAPTGRARRAREATRRLLEALA